MVVPRAMCRSSGCINASGESRCSAWRCAHKKQMAGAKGQLLWGRLRCSEWVAGLLLLLSNGTERGQDWESLDSVLRERGKVHKTSTTRADGTDVTLRSWASVAWVHGCGGTTPVPGGQHQPHGTGCATISANGTSLTPLHAVQRDARPHQVPTQLHNQLHVCPRMHACQTLHVQHLTVRPGPNISGQPENARDACTAVPQPLRAAIHDMHGERRVWRRKGTTRARGVAAMQPPLDCCTTAVTILRKLNYVRQQHAQAQPGRWGVSSDPAWGAYRGKGAARVAPALLAHPSIMIIPCDLGLLRFGTRGRPQPTTSCLAR